MSALLSNRPRPYAQPAHRAVAFALLMPVVAAGSGCSRGGGPQRGGPGSFAMPVEAVTLAEKPVEQWTEFVSSIKSRRSTTVQPQVEGFVTRIVAKSGDRVRPGSLLMEIDAGRQQAAVANLESQRTAREADVVWARQQVERNRKLLDAGAVSQAELEQVQNALSTSEAQLKAFDAQVQQQRLQLAYFRVTAPVMGVVGDIPVRVGDSVKEATVLTTIDHNAGFEVYVSVPVQQAKALKLGLPVHLLDDQGTMLATVPVSFVAPAVDEATQSVLAKAALADTTGFRADQYIRARVVWSDTPGLTIPVVALNRIGGQYFAYVVETDKEKGATVARQRSVELGPIVGNDYVVRSGLKAGDQLIVAGIQKIGDGMPVKAGPPAPPPADVHPAEAPAPKGE